MSERVIGKHKATLEKFSARDRREDVDAAQSALAYEEARYANVRCFHPAPQRSKF